MAIFTSRVAPMFDTLKVYVIVCPVPVNIDGLADFTIDVAGVGTLTSTLASALCTGPLGGLPVAVATLITLPASTSAWVVT